MYRKMTHVALGLGIAGAVLLFGGFLAFLTAMLSMMTAPAPGVGAGALPMGRLVTAMAVMAMGGIAVKLALGAGLLGVVGSLWDNPKENK